MKDDIVLLNNEYARLWERITFDLMEEIQKGKINEVNIDTEIETRLRKLEKAVQKSPELEKAKDEYDKYMRNIKKKE